MPLPLLTAQSPQPAAAGHPVTGQWALWAVAALALLLVSWAAARTKCPLKQVLISAVTGTGALALAALLAPITGLTICLNTFTSFFAVVLGVPGVVCLLVLRLVVGLP